MKTEPILIKITELRFGDIFSFRTIKRPIWWRFVTIAEGDIIYEEIRSKFRHTTPIIDVKILKK
jgi:hypothetical protein